MAENTIEDQGGESDGNQNPGFGEMATREEEPQEGAETTETGQTEEAESTEGEENAEETGDGKEAETEPELTEKGTKKDPNPQSAVHQELANTKKAKTQMEQVLGDRDLLSKFIEQQYGVKVALNPAKAAEVEATKPVVKEYTAKDFESLDDVAKVVNGLQAELGNTKTAYETKIAELEGTVKSLQGNGKAQQLYTRMSEDVAELAKQPELDPKSPDYIPGLEEKIADRYKTLDFDEKSQTFRGNHSIGEVAHDFLDVVRMGKTRGSEQTQTVVKNKSEGAVRTSTKVKDVKGDDELKPGDSIAKGVSRLFG